MDRPESLDRLFREAVLVEAGAELDTRDKVYQATPLGRAEYGARGSNERAKGSAAIAAYLREIEAQR